MHTLKPLDKETLLYANDKHKLLVTMEEHSIIGGLFGAVAEELCRKNNHKPVLPIGINDVFVHAGSYDYQIRESGLEPMLIKERITGELKKR